MTRIAFSCCLAKQIVPAIGWVPSLQALGEDCVGVVLGARPPERRFIVHPGIDNSLMGAAEPEEEPESAEEFSAPPVTILRAERVSQLELRGVRIAWDVHENQVQSAFEKLVLGMAAEGLFSFDRLHCLNQSI